MSQVTSYKGLQKIYFIKILKEIIKIGDLENQQKKILDYGCGEKQLSKLLNKKIFNYDKKENLNEVSDLNKINFDVVVINHVLMYLDKKEITNLLDNIKKKNPNCEFIFGIGKQNIISKIAKTLTLNFDAHKNTSLSYSEQIDLIRAKLNIIKIKKNIFFMTDIIHANFK